MVRCDLEVWVHGEVRDRVLELKRSGVLISAVAFDLVQEAADKSSGHGALIAGLFAGCLVFAGGDWLIGRYGGSARKKGTGEHGESPRLPSCWEAC
jgi:hypothetical protein